MWWKQISHKWMVAGSPDTHFPGRLPKWGPLLPRCGDTQGHTQEETTEENHQVQEEEGRGKAERGTDIPVWGGRVWHSKCRDRARRVVSRGRVIHGLWLEWPWNKCDLPYLFALLVVIECAAVCWRWLVCLFGCVLFVQTKCRDLKMLTSNAV